MRKQVPSFVRGLLARYKLRRIAKNFHDMDYLAAYAARTDALVEIDKAKAIGGMWEDMGKHQLAFLVDQGLRPGHRILDIGCGTLRAGRLLIAYLEPASYFGFDISQNAIQAATELVETEGLSLKNPDLRVNEGKDLKFYTYQGLTFDFLIAQSVFSHLQKLQIRECFQHIGSIMHSGSAFFFTYHAGRSYSRRDATNFEYPFSFFEELAFEFDFDLTDLTESYRHPRGQNTVRMKQRK